jgi:hypothetical protein
MERRNKEGKVPLEFAEILRQLEEFTGKFPRAAVEEAVARREEITPELLRILQPNVTYFTTASKMIWDCREK